MPGLRRLGLITTAGMFLLLLSGSLVTNTGSAQGCGNSWPFCDGDWASLATLIEVNHRLITGVLGLLILALSVLAWRAFPGRRDIRALVGASLFFLLLQSFLGAAAVLWGSPPSVLATHFGVSLASFGSVFLLTVRIHTAQRGDGAGKGASGWAAGGRAGSGSGSSASPAIDPTYRRLIFGALAFTLILIYVGAYVRHSGAGLACQGWPLCSGEWVPALSGPTAVNFLHRVLAAGLVVYVGYMAYRGRSLKAVRPDLYRAGVWAFGLLVVQSLTGALVATTRASIASNMLHAAVLILYASALLYMAMESGARDAEAGVAGTGSWRRRGGPGRREQPAAP